VWTFLQENFGTLDFKHLCDLYRWKFLTTIGNKYAYCLPLVEVLDFQYHVPVYIAQQYNACPRRSIVSDIYQHFVDLCYQ